MGRRIQPLSLILFFSDMALVLVALGLATLLRATVPLGRGGALGLDQVALPWPVYLLAVICWGLGLVQSGAYDPERVLRWYREAIHVLWGTAAGSMLLAGLLFLSFRDVSRLQFLYFVGLGTLLVLAARALFRIYYRLVGKRRPGARSSVLVLGAGDLGQRVARVLLDHSRWGFNPVGYLDDDPAKQGAQREGLPVLGPIDRLKEVVRDFQVEEVWVALPARAVERLNWVVMTLEAEPVRIKVVPDYFSLALVRARPEVFGGIPIIGLREPVIEGWARLAKRTFDLAVASLLLVLFAPVMGLIALLIRLDSPGQVVFRQKRVGENGRLFDMLKFRTMVPEAERLRDQVLLTTAEGEIIHKRPDDPRVTRIGRFLRRYSLDELPQLINVIRGEMSLVGPRPEVPWLVDRYKPWQRKRFAVPQGITGWWQINGRSDKPMHLNTEDDLYYVYNYSLWLDILILLRTPIAVIQGKGAF